MCTSGGRRVRILVDDAEEGTGARVVRNTLANGLGALTGILILLADPLGSCSTSRRCKGGLSPAASDGDIRPRAAAADGRA